MKIGINKLIEIIIFTTCVSKLRSFVIRPSVTEDIEVCLLFMI